MSNSQADHGNSSTEFLEKRKASLERYLKRTAAHPILKIDPDFREFLESGSYSPIKSFNWYIFKLIQDLLQRAIFQKPRAHQLWAEPASKGYLINSEKQSARLLSKWTKANQWVI